MYIGPHTCMSGYVSAYHGVGKLCILLHTILCHAVKYDQNGDGCAVEFPINNHFMYMYMKDTRKLCWQ